jgi:hypothetical protein
VAEKKSEALKIMAEGRAAEEASLGMSEAQVMEAKAHAVQIQGEAEANVTRTKAKAEAEGKRAHVDVMREEGQTEADIARQKATAEADGIKEKAEAMKLFDGVGRDHEEFKLRLDMQKELELAQIAIQTDIAQARAEIVGEALKNARIDIVGGESEFFDKITESVTKGKAMDRMVLGSEVLSDVKTTFFNGDPEYFKSQMRKFVDQFGFTPEELKNLSVAGLMNNMIGRAKGQEKGLLQEMLSSANAAGLADMSASLL